MNGAKSRFCDAGPLVLIFLLCGFAGAQPAVPKCLEDLTLAKVGREPGCIDEALAAGEAGIAALATKLDLTEIPPQLELRAPQKLRLIEKLTTPLAVGVRLINNSNKPALCRTGAIKASAEIHFETFGFTWDGGAAGKITVPVDLERTSTYAVIPPGEPLDLQLRVPLETPMVGIYKIVVTVTYSGILTIPQAAVPDWPTESKFEIAFLPSRQGAGRRLVGHGGTLKIDLANVNEMQTAGQAIPISIMITSHVKEKLLLPEAKSFFASPYWYVILDTKDDQILDHGNVVPLAEMQPEKSSIDIAKQRLSEQERLEVQASILTRLNPVRETRPYVLIVGITVVRDHGEQEFWVGEAVSGDFRFRILSRDR